MPLSTSDTNSVLFELYQALIESRKWQTANNDNDNDKFQIEMSRGTGGKRKDGDVVDDEDRQSGKHNFFFVSAERIRPICRQITELPNGTRLLVPHCTLNGIEYSVQ